MKGFFAKTVFALTLISISSYSFAIQKAGCMTCHMGPVSHSHKMQKKHLHTSESRDYEKFSGV